jgi:solute carrier family 9 (sodium/hydrogen exchanger), member 8
MGDWIGTEADISFYFVIFAFLLALVLILSRKLHDYATLSSILPEVGMILIVGIIAGTIVTMVAKEPVDEGDGDDPMKGLLLFTPNVFFIALLPPIIFNSGYHLRIELFLRHLIPICLFACVGTIVSSIVIGLLLKAAVFFEMTGDFNPTLAELFTFGALISATDTVSTLAIFQAKRVDPHLFYLVFGESGLNDAVSLVLFDSFANFVKPDNGIHEMAAGIPWFLFEFIVDFIGSSVLGILSGLLAAFLLKLVDMRKFPLLELSLYILIMYVPYLFAEIMHLSGIVTILFTGIIARRYCVPNLSLITQANSDVVFRLAAHVAEVSIFLELGLSISELLVLENKFQWRFILWAIFSCLIGRAANVYPITFFFNKSLRNTKESSIDAGSDVCGHIEMTDKDEEKKDEERMIHPQVFKSTTPTSLRDLKITWNTAHMLWFSGFRGAVAYACVRSFPDAYGRQTEFVVVTMVIVLVTVFFFGGTTELMLYLLEIDVGIDEDNFIEQSPNMKIFSGRIREFENFYVQRFVLRDFQPQEPVCRDGIMRNGMSERLETNSDYQSHVEVSEAQHLDIVTKMKKQSLYDYGSHGTL